MLLKGKVLLKIVCGAGTHTSTYSDEFLGKKNFCWNILPSNLPKYLVNIYSYVSFLDWICSYCVCRNKDQGLGSNLKEHETSNTAFHTWLFCTVVSTFWDLEENFMYDSAISNIFRAYKKD